MKALILVGGYGTRLRPLTLSVPKPLVQFCNKPMLEHQVAALSKAGVTTIILAVAYQSNSISAAIDGLEKKYNVSILVSKETEPLGTAGPIRLAKSLLITENETSSDFFVMNSDIICNYPLSEMINFHRRHHKEGTILTTRVGNPQNYGVVLADSAEGRIASFVEKPKHWVGDYVNAGIYIFKKSVIDRIEAKPTSIEKETFPAMALEGQLYAMKHEGYWQDVGKPRDFIEGMKLHLDHLRRAISTARSLEDIARENRLVESTDEFKIIGNVLIENTATIGRGCLLGPDVTVGPGCSIGEGVRISESILMSDVTVSSNSYVKGTILGWASRVGMWTRVEDSVVGEDVDVADECLVNGAVMLPHTKIHQSILEEGKIIM